MNVINKKKIIIATGGTGGHIFPAYSLAKNFIKNNHNVKIITDKRGLKYLEKHKNIEIIINNSATSDVFTTPLIFVKRVKTYKEFQVYEREKHLATLLKKFDWYPEMLYSDDVNQLFIFTNVGVPITSKTKPTDLERQFNKILSDLKSINVKHNDIKIGELLVDKNNKLYLCDFGWASVNNDLGCGIGLYDCEKPGGILDDNSTLERLNLL